MKSSSIGITLLFTLLLVSFMKSDSNSSIIIFDFTSGANLESWNTLNDGVMGGVSASTFKLDESGHGLFEGNVSTANNGGFASVRHQVAKVNLTDKKIIEIRLKGDGKAYQFRVKKRQSDAESYITTFTTSGSWETIEINLSDLYPSFRGRTLDRPNYDVSSMEELSFLIANKKNESFQLLIDSISLR